MRTYLLTLLLITGLAQASGDVTVRTLKYAGKVSYDQMAGADDVKIPFVSMANAKVAASINDQLFISLFGVMAPAKPGEVVGAAEHLALESTMSQDFSVSRNSGRVLTIAIDAEGCGAYCENYSTYYSFDTRNGHAITVNDVLTPAAMVALGARMKKERIAKYKEQLAQLRGQLKTARKQRGAKAKVDIDDLNERVAMNADCLETAEVPDNTAGVEAFAYNKVELADDAFRITRSRCSNHASRALDDVGDVTLAIAYKDMRNHLTSYGKALLLNEGDASPASSPFGQLLRGHLGGTMAITMLLQKDPDNAVSGVYFYDKFRTPIPVSGRLAGNALELTEADASGAQVAKITLNYVGGHLKGRWMGKKEFSMELNR